MTIPAKFVQAGIDPRYVNVTGDTMTGPLVLHANPTQGLQAATKAYVDSMAGGAAASGIEFLVGGPFYVAGITSGDNAIMVQRVNAATAISSALLVIFLAGTSGSLEVDVERKPASSSTWTSIFSVRPEIQSASGNYAESGGVLNLSSLSEGDFLRLQITKTQVAAEGFALLLR